MMGFMPRIRLSLLASGALLVATAATAQTMDFACPEPGTRLSFDSGVTIVARDRAGMDCTMDTVGGDPFKIRGLLIANPSSAGADTSAFIASLRPERLWPLAVGKKIEASHSAGGKRWTYVLSVANYEKRLGPGGALFDTFLIEMNEQGADGFRSVSRWWIAPALNYFIRFDASTSTGTSSRAVVTEVRR